MGSLLTRRKDEVADFPELVRFEFAIKEKRCRLCRSLVGLQFANQELSGYAPKGVDVIVRKH